MLALIQRTVRWGLDLLARHQFLRFLITGGINTVVGYGIIFGGMYGFGLSPELSNIFGYGVGLVVSYILHKSFTFKSRGYSHAQLLRFLIVFGVAYGTNFALLLLLVRGLDVNAGISQIIAGAAYVIVSYVMNKAFVFRPTPT